MRILSVILKCNSFKFMKKKVLTLVLIISWCSAYSQLLWKVTSKNQKNPSYIFASSPYCSSTFTDSIDGIFKRFSDCNVVIGETSMNRIDYDEKVFNASLLPRKKNLGNFISDNDKDFVNKELNSILKLQLADISAIKPAVLFNLYKDELIKRTLFLTTNELDMASVFQTLATDKGKTIIGVIGIDEIISTLSDTTKLKEETDFLIDLMYNRTQFQKEIQELNAFYKTTNLNQYFDLSLQSKFAYRKPDSDFEQKLERTNQKYLEIINQTTKTTTAFIVVDVNQLPGDKGLLKMLKESGYKVELIDK